MELYLFVGYRRRTRHIDIKLIQLSKQAKLKKQRPLIDDHSAELVLSCVTKSGDNTLGVFGHSQNMHSVDLLTKQVSLHAHGIIRGGRRS